MEKGREEGINTGIERTAIKMLRKGEPEEKIQEYTELTIEKIRDLKNQGEYLQTTGKNLCPKSTLA